MLSRADLTAISLTSLFAVPLIAAYVFDALGLGLMPYVSVALGLISALTLLALARHATANTTELAMFGIVFVSTLTSLLWYASPDWLPTGSGPDLTHHLMLVDYIEHRQTLVHDPGAAHQLGEMAAYTPGLHLLAALAATVTGRDGLFTIYPIIATSVALKFAVVALIVMGLTRDTQRSMPLLLTTLALLVLAAPLTLHSFTHDSYLAQVLSEMFALVLLWMLVTWARLPTRTTMAIFGVCGAAAFLTWPVWTGPLLITLVLTLAAQRTLTIRTRLAHAAIACAPILLVAILHSAGRLNAASIVGVSGAIPPALGELPWWPLIVAAAGIALCLRELARRPIVFVLVGLTAQAVALWLLARRQGSATPYMAIKMSYLAIYPVLIAIVVALAALARRSQLRAAVVWLVAVVLVVAAINSVRRSSAATPVVATDLYAAGVWARTHLPNDCVDYLVGNEFTAYWLHLAVLRNARLSARSANNDLYLTAPSLARWIEDGSPPYAIARRSILPADIRNRTRILAEHGDGDAIVIARVNSTPGVADGTCAASTLATGS